MQATCLHQRSFHMQGMQFMHGAFCREIAILIRYDNAMKRPSSAFLHDDIAAHLGKRELDILAHAEEYQLWDYERQKALFSFPENDASAVLKWLKETLTMGEREFSGRWPAGVSVMQARSRIKTNNASPDAQTITRIDRQRNAVAMAAMSILAPDDRYTVLYERDAMTSERITTGALLALIEGSHTSAEEAVRASIRTVSLDILGFDVSEDA